MTPGPADGLRVMTRNLYVGTDPMRPLAAAADAADEAAAPVAVGHAVHAMRADLDRTDFRVRAGLLAAEVRATRPDLVGVQEVALWRTGPADPATAWVPDAEQVLVDFRALLLEALGDEYAVVAEHPGEDVEATGFAGSPHDGSLAEVADLRLTVADLLLARADVVVTASGHGRYAARAGLELAGRRIHLPRGYAWADVERAGRTVRVVTTHLESVDPALAAAQAAELVADPVVADGPDRLVVLGDLNSDPHLPERSAAYRTLVGAGLVDLCLDGGPTYGFGALLDDPEPAFTEWIDHVLGRGVAPLGSTLTGTTERAGGLWASDHAGVVARVAV